MMFFDYALAFVLIASPDLKPADLAATDSPITRAAIISMALSMELMDEKEENYMFKYDVFNCEQTYVGHLVMIRNRYVELHDAPPDSDKLRFPCKDACGAYLLFNRQYKQQLEAKLNPSLLTPFPRDINQAVEETDLLYLIWDTARDTQIDYYYITVRRTALKNLRTQLGVKNYNRGILPPPVPVWRFSRID